MTLNRGNVGQLCAINKAILFVLFIMMYIIPMLFFFHLGFLFYCINILIMEGFIIFKLILMKKKNLLVGINIQLQY